MSVSRSHQASILAAVAAVIGALAVLMMPVTYGQTAGNTLQTIQPIAGAEATNVSPTRNPVLVGAEVISSGSIPAIATSGNQRRLVGDVYGSLFVRTGGPNIFNAFQAALSTTLTQLVAAPGQGSIYVTELEAVSTTTTASTFQLKYGTGANCGTGTTIASAPYISPGSASNPTSVSHPSGMGLIKLPASNALCAVCGSATNTCFAWVSGFIGL